jgi:hypothetical protein
MRRSLRIIVLCLLLIVAGVLYYLYAGSAAPVGQPPLTRIDATNFSEMRSAFNAANDSVRLVALLSPT